MFSSCSLTLTAAWGSICKSESLSRIILSYNTWQCNIIRCMMAAVLILLLLMVSGPFIQLVTLWRCVLLSSAYLWLQDSKRCSVKVISLLGSRTGSLIIHYANNPAPSQDQVAFIILKQAICDFRRVWWTWNTRVHKKKAHGIQDKKQKMFLHQARYVWKHFLISPENASTAALHFTPCETIATKLTCRPGR